MTHIPRQRGRAAPDARIGSCLMIALLGLLAGCSAPPTAVERKPAEVVPAATTTTKTSPLAEKQRLATALQGTPAVLALQADNSLRIDLPLRSCFDRGRAIVKPALAQVLDRMAASQRNETTRLLVAAPTDPGDNTLALAMQRAVTARDYLVERGLDASRF